MQVTVRAIVRYSAIVELMCSGIAVAAARTFVFMCGHTRCLIAAACI